MSHTRTCDIGDSSDASQAGAALAWTGERMIPEQSDPATFWEHVYRYRFAADFVAKKRVLDIACGEGYGTKALLEAGAHSVIGVDVSEHACAHARKKYQVDARQGSAEAIPVPDGSVDTIVSFETIEHVDNPGLFLDECIRVLDRDGDLIISTPNRDIYKYNIDVKNIYHVSEMSEMEFVDELQSRFRDVRVFSQSLKTAAWWNPRSLSAQRSSWQDVRGYWRLRFLLLSKDFGMVDEESRRSPVGAILGKDRPLASLLNPFQVLRRSYRSGEAPRYIIAIARKK
jgi:SAM-dependent methyltransferase